MISLVVTNKAGERLCVDFTRLIRPDIATLHLCASLPRLVEVVHRAAMHTPHHPQRRRCMPAPSAIVFGRTPIDGE